jgi:hypothetical protein
MGRGGRQTSTSESKVGSRLSAIARGAFAASEEEELERYREWGEVLVRGMC